MNTEDNMGPRMDPWRTPQQSYRGTGISSYIRDSAGEIEIIYLCV